MSNIQSISADGRGISREWDERLSEAQGIIGQYAQDGDDGRLHFEYHVDALVAEKLRTRGGEVEKWEDSVKDLLKARATDEATVYPLVKKPTKADENKYWVVPQGVALDIGEDSVAEAKGRDWGLPVPYIHFAELRDFDSLYSEGTKDSDGIITGACRYVAIAFDPEQAVDEECHRTIVWNGQPETVKSDWDATGYVGIVRTFGSYSAMKQARKDLVRALKAIHTDPTHTDEEPDPYADNEHLDDVDYNEPGL